VVLLVQNILAQSTNQKELSSLAGQMVVKQACWGQVIIKKIIVRRKTGIRILKRKPGGRANENNVKNKKKENAILRSPKQGGDETGGVSISNQTKEADAKGETRAISRMAERAGPRERLENLRMCEKVTCPQLRTYPITEKQGEGEGTNLSCQLQYKLKHGDRKKWDSVAKRERSKTENLTEEGDNGGKIGKAKKTGIQRWKSKHVKT